ncbi:MAG TPA: hypothetical protein VIM70_03525 [Clostridium sp.]|uniref:hypothetical protein n=1 Tax=Clostridium sp. TaxID=1506 RepID=UPI002F9462E6
MSKNNLEETRELNKQSAEHKDANSNILTKKTTDASLEHSKKLNKSDANEVINGLSKAAMACMSSNSIDTTLQEKQKFSECSSKPSDEFK